MIETVSREEFERIVAQGEGGSLDNQSGIHTVSREEFNAIVRDSFFSRRMDRQDPQPEQQPVRWRDIPKNASIAINRGARQAGAAMFGTIPEAASGFIRDVAMSPIPSPFASDEKKEELRRHREQVQARPAPYEGAGLLMERAFRPEKDGRERDPRLSPDNAPYVKDFIPQFGAAQANRLAGEVGEFVPQMAPPALAAMATGGLGVVPAVVGGVSGGLMEGAQQFREAQQAGESRTEALRQMGFVTAGSGALNAIPFSNMVKVLPQRFRSRVASSLLTGMAEGFTEMSEGGVSATAQMKSIPQTQEEVRQAAKDIAEGVWNERSVFLAAALTGGGMGALGYKPGDKPKVDTDAAKQAAADLLGDMDAGPDATPAQPPPPAAPPATGDFTDAAAQPDFGGVDMTTDAPIQPGTTPEAPLRGQQAMDRINEAVAGMEQQRPAEAPSTPRTPGKPRLYELQPGQESLGRSMGVGNTEVPKSQPRATVRPKTPAQELADERTGRLPDSEAVATESVAATTGVRPWEMADEEKVSLISKIRAMEGVVTGGGGDTYLTADADIGAIASASPDLTVVLKDANGQRMDMPVSTFARLSKNQGFTDRLREVRIGPWAPSGNLPAEFAGEKLSDLQGLIAGEVQAEADTAEVAPIPGVVLRNSAVVKPARQKMFQDAIRDPRVRQLLRDVGVTSVEIVAPGKLSLSEQGNISKDGKSIQLSADAENPLHTMLHELAHPMYDRLSPGERAAWEGVAARMGDTPVGGYVKNRAWGEAFVDTVASMGEAWADSALEAIGLDVPAMRATPSPARALADQRTGREQAPQRDAEFVGWQEMPRGRDPVAFYNIPVEGGGMSTVTAETARAQGFNVPEPPAAPPTAPATPQTPPEATQTTPEAPEAATDAQRAPWDESDGLISYDDVKNTPYQQLIATDFPKWRMTKKDYGDIPKKKGLGVQRQDGPLWRHSHEMAVRDAVERGLPVPQEVLEDYPDLATDAPAPPVTAESITDEVRRIEESLPPQRRNVVPKAERPDLNAKQRQELAREEYMNSLTDRQRSDLSRLPQLRSRLEAENSFTEGKRRAEERKAWPGNQQVARRLEDRLKKEGVAYTRQDAAGGSVYFDIDGKKVRIADHEAPVGGGFSQESQQRMGEADIDINPHSGIGWRDAVQQIAPPAPPKPIPAVQKRANERVDKHGLTGEQKNYLTREIQAQWSQLPRSPKEATGKGDGRVVIKVPGDGTFIIDNQQAANAIHKRLTGKWIDEGMATESRKTGVASPVDPRNPPRPKADAPPKKQREAEDEALRALNAAKTPEEIAEARRMYERAMGIDKPAAPAPAAQPDTPAKALADQRKGRKKAETPVVNESLTTEPKQPLTPESIRAAALEAAGGKTETRVRLADLREKLGGTRAEQDAMLQQMQVDGELVLYRNDDPQDMKKRDHDARMWLDKDAPRDLVYLKPERKAEGPKPKEPTAKALADKRKADKKKKPAKPKSPLQPTPQAEKAIKQEAKDRAKDEAEADPFEALKKRAQSGEITNAQYLKERKRIMRENRKNSGFIDLDALAKLPRKSVEDIVKWLRDDPRIQFAKGLKDGVWDENVKRMGRFKAHMLRAKQASVALDAAVKETHKGWKHIPPHMNRLLSDAFKGEADINTLPEAWRGPVQEMRTQVDSLSRFLIRSGMLSAEMKATFEANIGLYAKRTYKAFNDPKWMERMPQEVRNNMFAYLSGLKHDKGKRKGQPLYPTARDVENTMFQILKEAQRTGAYVDGIMGKGTLGTMNRNILKHRKDLPQEYRDFLGEEHDIRINFFESITSMAHMASNYQFLKEVRDMGLGKFIWDPKDPNRPVDVIPISAETNKSLGPLAGMLAKEDFINAMQEAMDPAGLTGAAAILAEINGIAKASKTIGSAKAQVRNYESNAAIAMANGYFLGNPREVASDFALAHKIAWAAATGKGSPKLKALTARFVETGAGKDSNTTGELQQTRSLMDAGSGSYVGKSAQATADRIEAFMKKLGITEKDLDMGAKVRGTTSDAMLFLEELYQAGDDVWKAFAWLREGRSLMRDEGMSAKEAQQEAAFIVRAQLPTYSEIAKPLQWLRRNVLASPLTGFISEAPRILMNTALRGMSEIASKNPKVRKRGWKRMGSMAATMAAPAGITLGIGGLIGIDPDDTDDIRNFLPPWMEHSGITVLSFDRESGTGSVVDHGSQDPYAFPKAIWSAAMSGEDPVRGMLAAAEEVMEPFVQQELFAGAMLRLWSTANGDAGDKAVWNQSDPPMEKMMKAAVEIGKVMEPGTATDIRKAVETGEYAKRIGGMMSGFFIMDINIPRDIFHAAREYGSHAKDTMPDVYAKAREGKTKGIEEQLRQHEAFRKAKFMELIELRQAADRLGVDRKAIRDELRKAGLTPDDVRLVMAGTEGKDPERLYRPFRPSRDFRRTMNRLQKEAANQ